jgi:hypothetical protein
MTLPASGALSFANIQTEFGGSNPISLSEYYKNGSNVPSTVPEAVTASSLGGSNSANARYPAIGGYDPQINTFSRLYTQALWGDNGSTITFDRNFTVNKTGTYNYYVAYYIQNASKTATHTLYVGGSQVATHSLTAGNSTASATGTLSVAAGQTIRVTGTGGSAGWAAMTVYIGGSSSNNSSINVAVNANIPTSGLLNISDYYGGRKT